MVVLALSTLAHQYDPLRADDGGLWPGCTCGWQLRFSLGHVKAGMPVSFPDTDGGLRAAHRAWLERHLDRPEPTVFPLATLRWSRAW